MKLITHVLATHRVPNNLAYACGGGGGGSGAAPNTQSWSLGWGVPASQWLASAWSVLAHIHGYAKGDVVMACPHHTHPLHHSSRHTHPPLPSHTPSPQLGLCTAGVTRCMCNRNQSRARQHPPWRAERGGGVWCTGGRGGEGGWVVSHGAHTHGCRHQQQRTEHR